jgi:hypothetical protein
MMDFKKDPATKSVSFDFAFDTEHPSKLLLNCVDADASGSGENNAASKVSLVLTPQTTRGVSNTDMYVLSIMNVSCTGATIVAERVGGDAYWNQDLQFNYVACLLSNGINTGMAAAAAVTPALPPPAVQSGTVAASVDTVTTLTVNFPTSFSVDARCAFSDRNLHSRMPLIPCMFA